MSAHNCQTLINTGLAWGLEGHVGRTCMAAIENGDCMLGNEPHRDYYGNRIPSRTEVRPGTKGSREFVMKHHNANYVRSLEHVSNDVADAVLSEI